uniref:C2H2-type domain-containing protein n=1 Tax=Bionectria ochroleuca TaxID=29856 RepID=A0A8H7K8P4_BIOOC
MYKCGWNGCEKAYGTLNHLNAHVTMQSHGPKRTPEEFKEIRKEWKARKKEEENQRKAEEERQRQAAQAAQAAAQNGPDPQGPDGPPTSSYPGSRPVTLPPIGYQPAQYPAPPSGGVQQPLPDYQNHMYPNYPPPHSPYAQPYPGHL